MGEISLKKPSTKLRLEPLKKDFSLSHQNRKKALAFVFRVFDSTRY
jgi:hypothetical protein